MHRRYSGRTKFVRDKGTGGHGGQGTGKQGDRKAAHRNSHGL